MSLHETFLAEGINYTSSSEVSLNLFDDGWCVAHPHLRELKPEEGDPSALVLPSDPFGDIDAQLLASRINDKQIPQRKDRGSLVNETDQSYKPFVSVNQVTSICERLGRNQRRWRNDNTRPNAGPKCNVYVDAVMDESGLPRPWAKTGVPSCEKVDEALAKDARYERSWRMDYRDEALAREMWQVFDQRPGDIFVWNRPDNGIIHSAIADGTGKIYYAGSHTPTGFHYTKVEYFAGTPEHPKDYGPPTSVYRYKHFKD